MADESTSETPNYDSLSSMRKAFVDAYCGLTHDGKGRFNAYQSYDLAGYKANRGNATRLKANESISAAISEVLAVVAMRDNEAAAVIAEQARGSLHPFVSVGPGGRLVLDLSRPEAQANLHLVKKWKQKEKVLKSLGEEGEQEIRLVEIQTEVELHDAQSAAHKIRQAHGAYGAKGTEDDPIHHAVKGIDFSAHDDPGGD